MISLKTSDEIEIIREGADILGRVHGLLSDNIKPDVTTKYLDTIAEEYIRENGAVPSFQGIDGYKYATCISINDEVVHGIPSDNKKLKSGDIVSIDCGVYYQGYHSDSAYTYVVDTTAENKMEFLRDTKQSLFEGIEKIKKGGRIGDISNAIQSYVETRGYSVVRELVGHGVGRRLHEDPEVPNYGRRGNGPKLKNGMVIAIEPMINKGRKEVYFERDGWTVRTKDRSISAHFEHTVAVIENNFEILTTFDYINKKYKY